MNELEPYKHYLENEQGRSPQTSIAYCKDLTEFRTWLDSSAKKNPPTWLEVTAQHIRAFLQTKKDLSKHRAHRIISNTQPNGLRLNWTSDTTPERTTPRTSNMRLKLSVTCASETFAALTFRPQ
jgi:Phage integrase, N-terminal SAM-like domain